LIKNIILLLIFSINILAQDNILNFKGKDFTPNAQTIEKINPTKPIWIPALEIISFNLFLSSYNKYIAQSDFAQISIDSIKSNFKYGWGWDADDFNTNMWKHPFQGSIYFNMARSNGYNYWISLLMTSFGSIQWEYFMEIEHPSINDLITTTIQGAIFGEVFYRISSLFLNETTTKKRVWRELGTAGFNPGRSLNRVLYNRSFRTISKNLYTTKPYKFNIALGVNDHSRSIHYDKYKRRSFLGLNFIYGDLFKQRKYKPLDVFNFEFEIQSKPEFSLIKFRILGILLAKSFDLNLKKKNEIYNSRLIIGLFHYTDYLKNDVFDIGSVSIGPGIIYLSPTFWYKNRIIINTTVAIMPMSGVNSNYAKEFIPDNFDEGRDYNLSTGISAKEQFIFTSKYVIFRISHSFWSFWTLQGAKGKEFINIFEPALIFTLDKHIKIGSKALFYYRDGKYGEFPNLYVNDRELRIFISLDI